MGRDQLPEPKPRCLRRQVGRSLKRLRLSRGYSLKAVADDLGYSTTAISFWERGMRPLSIDQLCHLASYFRIAVVDLFDVTVDTANAAPCCILKPDAAPPSRTDHTESSP